jgi:hypothetical protein
VYSLSGPFQAGQAFAGLDTVGTASQTTELDTLNLSTGALSPFVTGFTGIKGIVWTPLSQAGSQNHGHHHGSDHGRGHKGGRGH